MGPLEEELMKVKERLSATKEERDRALDELEVMKKMAEDTNIRLSQVTSTTTTTTTIKNDEVDIRTELNSVMESLSSAKQELEIKDRDIESLKLDLEMGKDFEAKLADKAAALDEVKEELRNVKASEAGTLDVLAESKKRIQELEEEIQKGKESERRMLDSLAAQTKHLEETKISLEESKLEIASLGQKVETLSSSSNSRQKPDNLDVVQRFPEDDHLMQQELRSLRSELLLVKESEQRLFIKNQILIEENDSLKKELGLINGIEENSKKAMDDLALALKEVATEASQAKEKIAFLGEELEQTKAEAERLKMQLKNRKEKYKNLLDESRKEADLHRNTAERLRVEAEESLMAWNARETGFVLCIKKTEEEKVAALDENTRLLELLREAENRNKTGKQENNNLRDILKQALSEANAAKEAAVIAQAENSHLHDAMAERETALNLITEENEKLRNREAAALEDVKELKQMLAEISSTKESESQSQVVVVVEDEDEEGKKLKHKNEGKEHEHKLKQPSLVEKELEDDGKIYCTAFSFNLMDLMIPHKHKDVDHHEDHRKHANKHEDHSKNKHEEEDDEDFDIDPLKGSIFDIAESPCHAPRHKKRLSTTFSDNGDAMNSEYFDPLDMTQFEDDDRSSRKKKALLRRFGDLIRKRSFDRK